ncbi:MAG: nickel insertion protein, partial [Pseudomonadota bacterium]
MHIHLDPVGGIAGDMFVAAMLDAFPDQVDGVLQAVRTAGLGDDIALNLLDFDDGVLTGKRFEVRQCAPKMDAKAQPEQEQPGAFVRHRHPHDQRHDQRQHDHSHHGHDHDHHAHTHWAHLRQQLSACHLTETVKRHAIGIFTELAWAEAKVHGKEIGDVTFHEVGNWDSIADIVGAAAIIDALSIASWSVGSLPIGRGRVKTAHGELPVP